jgi:hypothetical protein
MEKGGTPGKIIVVFERVGTSISGGEFLTPTPSPQF